MSYVVDQFGRDVVGMREDTRLALRMAVRTLLLDLMSSEELHAEAVAAGPFRWRQAFTKALGHFYKNSREGCDNLANRLYADLSIEWDLRHPQQDAREWLDQYAPVSPLTQQEIDDAWELEIAGSETALRAFYEGSARIRKGADLGARSEPLRPKGR